MIDRIKAALLPETLSARALGVLLALTSANLANATLHLSTPLWLLAPGVLAFGYVTYLGICIAMRDTVVVYDDEDADAICCEDCEEDDDEPLSPGAVGPRFRPFVFDDEEPLDLGGPSAEYEKPMESLFTCTWDGCPVPRCRQAQGRA